MPRMKNPEVSFIIPMYNEVAVFALLIDRMNALASKMEETCEVILVDDGSNDGTSLLMESLAVKDSKYQCIFLSRNFGQQKALGAGLDLARGEYIMFLDADLQDPPELYFEFLQKIKQGYDVVYGVRKGRKEGVFKRGSYNLFYKFLNWISNYPIPKNAGDFGMITKRVAKAINLNKEENRFLRGIRSWVGFNQIGIDYERRARAAGYAKYSLNKLIKLGLDGIFNFTTIPVKVLTLFGVLCITSAGIYFVVTVVRKYVYQDVPTGFTALLFVVILFGGFQSLSLGIIGEYIQRIFFQVKQRPLYLVKKKIVNGVITYE